MLPIQNVIDELLLALRTTSQVILQAPPGAGKSTHLPLTLLQQPWLSGKILMLEPRRLAARGVAARLAEQLGETPGQTVGYRMRSESRVSQTTRLEVITEGILTRRLQQDPLLTGVSLVILDEFHERSLQADLALTLLLDIQQGLREDLRLLIMSATLDNQALAAFLPAAATVCSQGRSFAVEREYLSLANQKPFHEEVAYLSRQIMAQHPGSLLVFLPGVAEIKRVQDVLAGQLAADIDICPLYGALPLVEQRQAILPAPPGRRKIVLATNIAETSLTIEGIGLVVDSARERVAVFDARTGLTRLITQRISKASMVQRAGRAGRLGPGRCWHLLAKEQAERAIEQSEPEILHGDLTALWLELLQWGCRDFQQLKWLNSPPLTAVNSAKRLLQQLKLTDEQGILTTLGKEVAQLPCEPRLGVMLVLAKKRGDSALATAAMLAAILEEPPRRAVIDLGDWLHQPLSHWRKRAKQLRQLMNCGQSNADIRELPYLLLAGYPDRIARRRGHAGNYLLSNGSGAGLAPNDALAANEWLVAPALLQSEVNANARILLAAAFEPSILETDFPHLISDTTTVEWNDEQGTLRTIRRWQVGQISLRQNYLAKPSAEQLQQALLNWVKVQGIDKLNWDESASQLRHRLLRAREWLPEYSWPDISDNSLIENLDVWLLPSLENVRDMRGLRSLNVAQALTRLMDWQQKQRLDQLLPHHYRTPTGSSLPVRYYPDRPPVLAVRLQEMFGERESPKIALGRVAVVLELLSPAQRPIQITGDLKGFWNGAYSEVKKEMKGRYPKHVWPDDPANAKPTRKTKKHQ